MPAPIRANNAEALSKALILCTTIPWLGSLVIYSGLHCTYPRDRQRVASRLAGRNLSVTN